jgi:hypothetical protein
MTLNVTMTSPAFGGPVLASGDAVVDPRDHALSMSMLIDFSQVPQVSQALGSPTMQMDMILDGESIYMQIPPALRSAAPQLGGKTWIRMNLAKLTGVPGLSSLGNDPTMSNPGQLLQYLRAASGGVTNEGRQRVDGVPTTHYHAELSLDSLATNVPAGDRAAVQQALSKLQQATNGQGIPVDVWVDAHHLVRRMSMVISLAPPTGPALEETVTADLTDYGQQPRPTLPPADQVTDLSSLAAGAGTAS